MGTRSLGLWTAVFELPFPARISNSDPGGSIIVILQESEQT